MSNECLVYIENKLPDADVDGYTYIGQLNEIGETRSNVTLLTDEIGNLLNKDNVIISNSSIVSNRPFKDISPKKFYHLSTNIIARSFVIKSKTMAPLETTSRSALGSGIYGRYILREESVKFYLTDNSQKAYLINCEQAYPIQDKEHLESLTVASLTTNRYIDKVIQVINDIVRIKSLDDVANIVSQVILSPVNIFVDDFNIPGLLVLWNIVYFRTKDVLSQKTLEDILIVYVTKYITEDNLRDTTNDSPIQELPINNIMKSLRYNGIIGTDRFTNSWDKGCIYYDLPEGTTMIGENARY